MCIYIYIYMYISVYNIELGTNVCVREAQKSYFLSGPTTKRVKAGTLRKKNFFETFEIFCLKICLF